MKSKSTAWRLPVMKWPTVMGWCLVVASLLPAPAGYAQPTASEPVARDEAPSEDAGVFPDEPAARALYDAMVRTLQEADSFSCQASYRWERAGRELGRSTYHLWLKKPGYARLEGYHEGQLMGTLVGDGKQFWIFWPDQRPMFSLEGDLATYEATSRQVYLRDVVDAARYSIAHQAGKLGSGMGMLILQPSIFHGKADSLEPYLDAVRGQGTEVIGDELCDVVEVSYMKGQRSKYFWIARSDSLPRRLKEVVRVGGGDILFEEEWTEVTRNGELADDLFTWTPAADWREWQVPDIRQGVLAAGTLAPPFELSAIDGQRVKLADLRGSVVWLVFWRLGCPPCRVEFPELERLHRKSSGAGLVVLGFNCADEKELVARYLEEQSITFTNIVDNSDEAQKVFFEHYQKTGGSGVPLNYIIDRDGRVAAGWYGYDQNDRSPHTVLESLGIP
jgi:peroxiredoxin/outer membrane lipoprotein-sorting protein